MPRTDNVVELATGKEIELRESFPLGEFGDIMQTVYDANLGDLQTCVPMLTRLVVAGDLPGEPDDPETYQQMDALREIYPLARATIDYVEALLYGEPKNAASDSSSP